MSNERTSQTTADDDLRRALFGKPRCAKGHGDCHPDCEYGLAGPCLNSRVKETDDAAT